MFSGNTLAFNVLPRDGNAIYDWIMKAPAEQEIAYYRGHLGRDREVLPQSRRTIVAFAADVAMAAAEAGFVIAHQMRLGELDYLYVCRRTKRRFDPVSMQKSLDTVFARRFENVKSKDSKQQKEQLRMAQLDMLNQFGSAE